MLSTAVYLRNRSPTEAVERVAPLKPSTERDQMLGTFEYLNVCFAHITTDVWKKLDAVARRCVC